MNESNSENHSLLLLITGSGFLSGTFGWADGDQGSVYSILGNPRIHRNSEYSAETRKSKNGPQLFDGRQKSIKAGVQHYVASSVGRFPFGMEISGSSGSTLSISETIVKKDFQRKLHNIQNSGRPKVTFDSLSTPIFGRYMSVSRDRFIHQLKRLRSSIGKPDSMKKTDNIPLQVNTHKIRNPVVNNGLEVTKMTSTGTSSGEIIKSWSESKHDEKKINNEGTIRKVRKAGVSDKELVPKPGRLGTNGTTNITDDDNSEANNKTYVDNNCNHNNSDDSNCKVNNNDDDNTNKIIISDDNNNSHNLDNDNSNKTHINSSALNNIFNNHISNNDENNDNNNNHRDNNYSNINAIEMAHSTKVTLKKIFTKSVDNETKASAKNLSKSEQKEPESEIHIRKPPNVSSLSGRFTDKIQQREIPEKNFRLLNAEKHRLPSIVSSISTAALISNNLGNKNKSLREESEKKPTLSDDAEAPQTLSKAKIEKLLEFGMRNSGGSCQVVFKALLALIANEKANKNINSKTKRSPKKMANQTKEQTHVSTRRSSMAPKDHSMSTISFVANSSISPNKSSLLNIGPVSTKSVPVKNKILTDNSSVPKTKNISAKLSIVNNKSMSTIISMLKNQSAPTEVHTTNKFISTEASTSNNKPTSTEHSKLNNNSASMKSSRCSTSDDLQTKNEKDSALSFISRLLRHLRTQLPTGNNISNNKNGSDTKTKAASSIIQLIDYITSFMKLSYNIVDALMNKTDLKADVMNKQTNRTPLSTEVSVLKAIFTRLVSDMLVPIDNKAMKYNSTASENDQSQSREQILLTNEITKQLNGTNVPLTSDRNATTVQDFRTLISLARSDSKYVKDWSDSVLAFLSKQSHHFMESGIYERLSSFWPRSSLTAESWTLRLAGYCAQIEIDENMAVLDSRPLFCPFKNPKCDKYAKYRDPAGICNNLENPLWGSANIPFRRQLKNAYDDGVSKPRSFGKGRVPLPNAKLVSKSVFDKNDGKSVENMNLFTVFFTQFVSHDITRFAMDIGDIGPVKVNCCLPDTLNRSECFPIFVEEENEPTVNVSVRCLHFLRSMPTVPLECQSHVREQINQVTSFIDASNVYGSSLHEMKELRLFHQGLMKMALCGPESLPPTDRKGASECGINADQRQFPCFYAGDPRVNENPALALVHVLWLREHNRIARRLGEINPHWDDTQLYDETRKIVSALMQHVVYNELLPLILGFEKAKEFGLLSEVKFFNDYEPKTNPTLENGVATAAFRFGHGMIADRFLFLAGCPSAHSKCSPQSILIGPNEQERRLAPDPLIAPPMCPYMTQKNVSAMFENVDVFHQSETELESLLRGLLMQSAEVATDTMLAPAVTEKLFGHMDLMARNVQRGRDHGLPAYNKWREWCGLPVARKFHSNKTGFIDHKMEVVKRFAQVYNHPEDVDLIIGGLTEIPIEGGILGPTFVCIIGKQFKQLKFGDRFWYETEGQFTQDQLREIRMMKVSHILLNNAGIESVPKFAFYKGSNDNPFITSVDQVQLELSLWKDDKTQTK